MAWAAISTTASLSIGKFRDQIFFQKVMTLECHWSQLAVSNFKNKFNDLFLQVTSFKACCMKDTFLSLLKERPLK